MKLFLTVRNPAGRMRGPKREGALSSDREKRCGRLLNVSIAETCIRARLCC